MIQILLCLTLAAMGMMMVSFSAAGIQIAAILDVNINYINMCMGAYMFVSAFFAVPANYLNDRHGVHFGVYIGVTLFLIGAWLRIFIDKSIFYALIGSLLGGSAFCFVNAPAKIAAVWFGAKETGLRTTIITAMVPLGCMVSFFLPSQFIPQALLKKLSGVDLAAVVLTPGERLAGQNSVLSLIYTQNYIITAIVLAVFLFWRKRPPSPPSLTSASAPVENCCKAVGELLRLRNYVLMVVCFNIVWSVYGTVGALVSSITAPYGFGPTHNAVFSICFILFGLVGSFTVGRTLDKRKNFRCVHISLSGLLVVSLILVQVALWTRSPAPVAIAIGTLGISVLPFLPLSFLYGAQLTYPLGQAMMGGLLLGTSQAFAVVVLFLVQGFVDVDIWFGLLFLFALVSCNFMISLCIQQDLRRDRAESQASDLSEKMMTELKEGRYSGSP